MSKYDSFWLSIIDVVRRLLREAYLYGRSKEVDVSGLRRYGSRKSWYGVAVVSRSGVEGVMVHVVSLGRLILRMGLLEEYGDVVFRIKVSSKLRLSIERVLREPLEKHYNEVIHDHRDTNIERVVLVIGDEIVSEEVYLRIHELLEALPLYRYPVRRDSIPSNGIYFFYEEGEVIVIGDKSINRIVRVGTHRSQGRLADRIYNHYHGNKNSSVFRRHLGSAILIKENPRDPRLQVWKSNHTVFRDVEEKINDVIRKRFSFRCIRVDDPNERLELEERLISTLAKYSPKYVSPNWLGRYAQSEKVRNTGMWNSEHVDSNKYMTAEYLARLEQLIRKTLEDIRSTHNSALILIPCCKTKNTLSLSKNFSPPLPRITGLREKLLELIRQTRSLREKEENKRGILNLRAPIIRAIDLYSGSFYQEAREKLLEIANGKYPNIHVLIVSAFYGLVKLNEGIREYDVSMNDKLANNMKVYKYWLKEKLWIVLLEYIRHNNITHIWSLLPNSPNYPYHRVFQPLWVNLQFSTIRCFHVRIPGAGSVTPRIRAKWLTNIIEQNPDYLLCRPCPPTRLKQISHYTFTYTHCYST